MTLELTRRDALAALAVGTAGGGALSLAELDATETPSQPPDLDTLLAVAETVYPAEVTATREFLRPYVSGLSAERRERMADAIERLDAGARRHAGGSFASLSVDERGAVLDRLGVSRVRSDPDGAVPERIRYHLVNSLLYVLFTSPRGSELVGIQNPTGHPGGYESLTRPPEGTDE